MMAARPHRRAPELAPVHVALGDGKRHDQQAQVADIDQRGGPDVECERQGDGDLDRAGAREVGPGRRDRREIVEGDDGHRRKRQILRVVHRVGEVPRRDGQEDHRQDPRPGAEQPCGEPSAEHDADPAENGVDRVTDHIPVSRQPLLDRRAQRVEEAGVGVPSVVVEGGAATNTAEILPDHLPVSMARFLIPRHTEVERGQDKDREEACGEDHEDPPGSVMLPVGLLWWMSAPRRG